MVAWPPELPEYFESGHTETLAGDRLSSEGEGDQQTRRRTRSRNRVHEASVALDVTSGQFARFERFYRDELAGGVMSFDWVHPRTRAALAFRFRGPPPSYTSRASGSVIVASFTLVRLSP